MNEKIFIKKNYPDYKISGKKAFKTSDDFLALLNAEVIKSAADEKISNKIKNHFKFYSKKDIKKFFLHVAADLHSRMDYRREPRGLEILNQNWDKILNAAKIPADCDDFAYITATICRVLFPESRVYIRFVSMRHAEPVHHAYTVIYNTEKKEGKIKITRLILDIVRQKNNKRMIYKKIESEIK